MSLYLARFFRVVLPVSRLTVAAFVVNAAVGSIRVIVDPAAAGAALLPVLVLQAFAASTGFAVPARRGYYDLLLTRGDGRTRIALMQWLVSVTPGVVAWLTIAAAEAIAARGRSGLALSSGTVVAMVLVSTLPWAITVPLPRFSGAIGWLLLFVMAASVSPERAGITNPGALPTEPVATASAWLLLFPLRLVGHPAAPGTAAVIPALAVAFLAMIAAFVWIHRTDFPLEAAQ